MRLTLILAGICIALVGCGGVQRVPDCAPPQQVVNGICTDRDLDSGNQPPADPVDPAALRVKRR